MLPPKLSANKSLSVLRENPDGFVEIVFGDKLWQKQIDILKSVAINRNTSVRSCHASGKSFTAGRIALWFLLTNPNSIVLTTAPTWRQVNDVLWKEINAATNNAKVKLPGMMLKTRYNINPEWFAVGLSTDDPDKFQGYHAPSILIIIDESSGVQRPIFEAIEGVASTGNVRILELGNPTDPTGHFAETFKSPLYQNFNISCFDTPNFAAFPDVATLRDSTEERRRDAVKYPYLIAPQWVWERLQVWGEHSPMFAARCLGEFPLEGEDTLFPMRYVLAARVSEWLERDKGDFIGDDKTEVLGVDVARFGSDSTVLAHRHGNVVKTIERFTKNDLMTTVGRINQFHQVHPYAMINIDDAGVGGGVTDRLREMKVPVNPINVASSPKDTEIYVNLRAELYWNLAQLFEQGDIIIPDDDTLVAELTSMKYRYSNGKLIIESKDDMKKRGLKSPDSADAVVLAFADSMQDGFLQFMEEAANKIRGQ